MTAKHPSKAQIRELARDIRKWQKAITESSGVAEFNLAVERRNKSDLALRHRQMVKYFPHDPLRRAVRNQAFRPGRCTD